jgi:hypothetical protein
MSISNPGTNYSGLFAVHHTGTISNLTMENAKVVMGVLGSMYNYSGILAGLGSGTYTGIVVHGSIIGNDRVGGIFGEIGGPGSVSQGITEVFAFGSDMVGGAAGIGGGLFRVSSYSNVFGYTTTGGILGRLGNGRTLTDVYDRSLILGAGDVAGIAGSSFSATSINRAEAAGTIIASSGAAGITSNMYYVTVQNVKFSGHGYFSGYTASGIGTNINGIVDGASISDAVYSGVMALGYQYRTGGIMNNAASTMSRTENRGLMIVSGDVSNGTGGTGGILGRGSGVRDSYFTGDILTLRGSHIGGILGELLPNGVVQNSRSQGRVINPTGHIGAGIAVSGGASSSITQSSFTGILKGQAGLTYSSSAGSAISNSFVNSNNMSFISSVRNGGLALDGNSTSVDILNSYAAGKVSFANGPFGGIVGAPNTHVFNILNSFSAFDYIHTFASANRGSIASYTNASSNYNNLYYLSGPQTPSSCYGNATGGYAASSCASRTSRTYFEQSASGLLSTWDFAGESTNGTDDYWQFPPGGGLPYHGPDRLVRIATPTNKVIPSNHSSYTLTGTCTMDGAGVLTVSGSASATADCSSGVFSVNVDLSANGYGPQFVVIGYSNAPPDIMRLEKDPP